MINVSTPRIMGMKNNLWVLSVRDQGYVGVSITCGLSGCLLIDRPCLCKYHYWRKLWRLKCCQDFSLNVRCAHCSMHWLYLDGLMGCFFSLRAHKIVSYLSYKTTQVGFKMCFLHFCKLLGSKIKPGVKAGPSTKGLTICHKVSMAQAPERF